MTDLQTKTFHRFRELPPELRIIIWSLTIEGRDLKEGCHFRGLMSGAKAPHHNPPGIFFACYESRKIGLAEYEPFMGTFLHLKLDTLSIKGLYFDYLGPDWISAKELSNGRVTLREPFNNLHVTFTGPWTSTCQCVNEEAKTETCPLSDNQQSETVHEQLALAVGRRI